jgi:MraZ protein
MLLTGSFQRLLDDKLRFAVPKPMRDAIGHPEHNVLYLGPGTEGSLNLYPLESFAKLAARLENGHANGRDVTVFSRLFFAQVQRVELDKHGRIRLPSELAELARLTREVFLLGVRDHLEIWDRETWEAYLQQTLPEYDELAIRAVSGVPPASLTRGGDRTSFELQQATDSQNRPGSPK